MTYTTTYRSNNRSAYRGNVRSTPRWMSDPASDAQTSWIKSLLHGRDVDANTADEIRAALAGGLTKGRASGAIDLLKTYPVRKVEAAPAAPAVERSARPTLPEVPAGRYAVDTEAGHLAFYRVDRPTTGNWAGRTFVKVQASDELHPVRGAAAATVLAKIAADPHAASARYGHEIGACGVCGRTLTNEESRARGIGPVCAKRLGWL